jgi:hypothetical protein
MNELSKNISAFCCLFFCTLVFITRARLAKDSRLKGLGLRTQSLFWIAAGASGSLGLFCLCVAGVQFFG